MPQRRSSDPTQAWKKPEVIAAALAAAAAVTVAVINVAGDDDGGDDAATETPGPRIELLQTGTMPAQPPPAVSYWFEGRVQELRSNQRVFVFGYFDEVLTDSNGAAADVAAGQQPVSPPAEYFPGGTWRVDWVLAEPPGAARFEAVLVEVPTGGDAGNPGGPGAVPSDPPTDGAPSPGEPETPTEGETPALPSPGDALSQLIRDRLTRSGPSSPLIVARDDVLLEPTGSP